MKHSFINNWHNWSVYFAGASTLVMMVKRGNSFIVPNGQLELKAGDILLTIASQQG